MLIEFRTENHRSLKTEQALTMETGRVDGDNEIPRKVTGAEKSLLPVAAIYGANASGKSNVLSALVFMRQVVMESHRRWEPDEGVPRDPFAWGTSRLDPSTYEITFVDEESFPDQNVRYQYGFVISDEVILEEWLHAWPKGKLQVWFERDGQDFKFGENLKGKHRLIREVTRSNALFLSAAAQHANPQLRRVYSWFSQIESPIQNPRVSSFMTYRHVMNYMYLESRSKRIEGAMHGNTDSIIDDFRKMLCKADVGILDFRLVSDDREENSNSIEEGQNRFPSPRSRIQLKHVSGLEDSWLPLESESKGTKTLFAIGIPLLRALRLGSVVIVDELEASLHPKLALEIVRQFNDPKTNPRNAQLIFTTHDTNLLGNDLGEPVLRRDQVWLTEKDNEGATVLYPLTDYKPRKAENVERGYLQGRYGAIPYLGNFSLLNEASK